MCTPVAAGITAYMYKRVRVGGWRSGREGERGEVRSWSTDYLCSKIPQQITLDTETSTTAGHSHTATQEHSYRDAQLLASCTAESYTCTSQCA